MGYKIELIFSIFKALVILIVLGILLMFGVQLMEKNESLVYYRYTKSFHVFTFEKHPALQQEITGSGLLSGSGSTKSYTGSTNGMFDPNNYRKVSGISSDGLKAALTEWKKHYKVNNKTAQNTIQQFIDCHNDLIEAEHKGDKSINVLFLVGLAVQESGLDSPNHLRKCNLFSIGMENKCGSNCGEEYSKDGCTCAALNRLFVGATKWFDQPGYHERPPSLDGLNGYYCQAGQNSGTECGGWEEGIANIANALARGGK